MNKKLFLKQLSKRLRGLSKSECEEAINYYNEYFLDAGIDDTKDVTPLVGNVDEVAKRIIEENTEKQIIRAKKEGGIKNNSRALWLILLEMFAAPVAFLVALGGMIILFAFLVVAFALIIGVMASVVVALVHGIITGTSGITSTEDIFDVGSLLAEVGFLVISVMSALFIITKIVTFFIKLYEKKKANERQNELLYRLTLLCIFHSSFLTI